MNSAEMGSGLFVFGFRDSLRFVRLDRREISDIPLPAPGPIYGVESVSSYSEERTVYVTAVALLSGLVIYDENARVLTTLPYHYDIDRWGMLSISMNNARDRFQIQYEPSIWIGRRERDTMPTYIETVDLNGNVLASYTLPPLPKDVRQPTLAALLIRCTTPLAIFLGESAYQKIGMLFGSSRLAIADNARWVANWPATRDTLLWGVGMGLGFGLITLLCALRAGLSRCRALGWAGVVFAFGLPGFLVFLLTSEWPLRVACPSCRRLRPIDAAACPACAAPWPHPVSDGLEILDRPSAITA